MYSSLKNHPFAVEAFFESSLVLTFAVHKNEIRHLIPECLEPDTFLDELFSDKEQNVLIVSHVFVMQYLQKALAKRAYKGESFKRPEHGKLYLFERSGER